MDKKHQLKFSSHWIWKSLGWVFSLKKRSWVCSHPNNVNISAISWWLSTRRRHSWFKESGRIKNFWVSLSIFSPILKSPSLPIIQYSMLKGKLAVPELKVRCFMNHSITCTMKNPKVEVFGYPYSPKTLVIASTSPFWTMDSLSRSWSMQSREFQVWMNTAWCVMSNMSSRMGSCSS